MKIYGLDIDENNNGIEGGSHITSKNKATDFETDATEIKCPKCLKFKPRDEYFPSTIKKGRGKCRQCHGDYKKKKSKLIMDNGLGWCTRIRENMVRAERRKNNKLGKKKRKIQFSIGEIKAIGLKHISEFIAPEDPNKPKIHTTKNIIFTRKNPLKRIGKNNYTIVLARDAYKFDMENALKYQNKKQVTQKENDKTDDNIQCGDIDDVEDKESN